MVEAQPSDRAGTVLVASMCRVSLGDLGRCHSERAPTSFHISLIWGFRSSYLIKRWLLGCRSLLALLAFVGSCFVCFVAQLVAWPVGSWRCLPAGAFRSCGSFLHLSGVCIAFSYPSIQNLSLSSLRCHSLRGRSLGVLLRPRVRPVLCRALGPFVCGPFSSMPTRPEC